MKNLSQFHAIALITFKQLSQGRLLFNTGAVGMGLILLCLVTTKFTYGVPHRVALDIGLGLLSLSSTVIALSLGVGLISKEIESRTIYMVLSRSVARETFLLGKFAGLIAVMAINILILGTATLLVFYILGGRIDSLVLWAMFYILLEAELILLITVFFSLFTNKVLTIIITLTMWFLGHAIYDVLDSVYVNSILWLKTLLEYYVYFFPAFYKINLKDFVLYEQTMPWSYLMSGTAYAVIYSAAIIVFSCVIFHKKSLD